MATRTRNPFLELLIGDLQKLGVVTPGEPQVSPETVPKPTAVPGALPPPGGRPSEEGTWSAPFKAADGKYYTHNSTTDEYKLAPAPFQPSDPSLEGLRPLTSDPSRYFVESPEALPNATRFYDQYGNIVDAKGEPVEAAEYKRLAKQFGGLTDTSESDATAAGNLAERIRAQRIAEVQHAMDSLAEQAQQANEMRAKLAPYALAAGTEYFPGFGPNDPLIRSGLANPVSPVLTTINPNAPRQASQNSDQVAQDLARIRQLAGVGG